MECYIIGRFSKGSAPIEYLKNLPLDELNDEIEIVNKVAKREKELLDKET